MDGEHKRCWPQSGFLLALIEMLSVWLDSQGCRRDALSSVRESCPVVMRNFVAATFLGNYVTL